MYVFRIVHGCFGRISFDADENDKGERREMFINLYEHSLLIRGNVSVLGDSVVADKIEINSGSGNSISPVECLTLSEDGTTWNDSFGNTSTIQRFGEIVTVGKSLLVTSR